MLFRVSARLKPCPDKAAEFSTIAARLPFDFAQDKKLCFDEAPEFSSIAARLPIDFAQN